MEEYSRLINQAEQQVRSLYYISAIWLFGMSVLAVGVSAFWMWLALRIVRVIEKVGDRYSQQQTTWHTASQQSPQQAPKISDEERHGNPFGLRK